MGDNDFETFVSASTLRRWRDTLAEVLEHFDQALKACEEARWKIPELPPPDGPLQ